jgi:hypothetical protein
LISGWLGAVSTLSREARERWTKRGFPNHPLNGGASRLLIPCAGYKVEAPTHPAMATDRMFRRPGFLMARFDASPRVRCLMSTPASSGLTVAWVGCMLPCHYLHNRVRKLGTSQVSNLVMFSPPGGRVLNTSIRHSGWKRLRGSGPWLPHLWSGLR